MRILLELALLTRKSFWLCKRPCCFPMNINSMANLQMLGFLTRSELMRNSRYSLWSPVNAVLSTFIYWNHLHLVCTHIIRFQRCIVYSFKQRRTDLYSQNRKNLPNSLFQYLNIKNGVFDIYNIFLEKIIYDYLQQQLFSFMLLISKLQHVWFMVGNCFR